MRCTHRKIWWKSSQWLSLQLRKHYFCHQGKVVFSHLSCNDFDHSWNKRRKSVFACLHLWKISEFWRSCFYRPQNSYNLYFWGGTCPTGLQLKWHNFRRRFVPGASRHPVDMPFPRRLCWENIWFYYAPENPNFASHRRGLVNDIGI